jgi:hypothetical protein
MVLKIDLQYYGSSYDFVVPNDLSLFKNAQISVKTSVFPPKDID